MEPPCSKTVYLKTQKFHLAVMANSHWSIYPLGIWVKKTIYACASVDHEVSGMMEILQRKGRQRSYCSVPMRTKAFTVSAVCLHWWRYQCCALGGVECLISAIEAHPVSALHHFLRDLTFVSAYRLECLMAFGNIKCKQFICWVVE